MHSKRFEIRNKVSTIIMRYFSAVKYLYLVLWVEGCDSVLTEVYRADRPRVLTDMVTMERLSMRPLGCLHFADLAVCLGTFVYVTGNRLGLTLTVQTTREVEGLYT